MAHDLTRRPPINVARAAQYLGTSERHVRRLWAERRLTGIKLGGKLLFDPSELDAFLERNTVAAVR
ncbi:MAG: helix-turn-helix domain-containing protein [Acidimicrobiia bacterium]|nr:helix-turn-helix domain-containing protein [Acidimicrobiia bacterium]